MDAASTAILRMIAKTATEAARRGALGVETVAELSQLANALSRARGDKSDVNVAVDARTVVVTEDKRKELQARLKAIQDDDDSAKSSPAPITLSAPQTQPQANVGAGNSPL